MQGPATTSQPPSIGVRQSVARKCLLPTLRVLYFVAFVGTLVASAMFLAGSLDGTCYNPSPLEMSWLFGGVTAASAVALIQTTLLDMRLMKRTSNIPTDQRHIVLCFWGAVWSAAHLLLVVVYSRIITGVECSDPLRDYLLALSIYFGLLPVITCFTFVTAAMEADNFAIKRQDLLNFNQAAVCAL
jgi:hypothetical protein